MQMPTGWIVCCCSCFFPRPKSSNFASESRGPISLLPESISVLSAAIGVLPTAVGRDAGPDLTANCVHCSAGSCPIRSPRDFHSTAHLTVFRPIHRPTSFHFSTALPCIQAIVFRHSGECFLGRRSRMQSVGSPPCDPCPTVGPILHAGLSAVRSPIEASSISTVFFRRFRRNAQVSETSPQAHSCLTLPIHFGPLRFYAKYQHDYWYYYHRPQLLVWSNLPLQRDDTPDGPAVAIQDPHLTSDPLSNSDVQATFRRWEMASAEEI